MRNNKSSNTHDTTAVKQHANKPSSQEYVRKKQFFDRLLTIYGRKPVLEALQDPHTQIHRLHLADSNKSAPILNDIKRMATEKGAEVLYHDRKALSRISKNTKQDQGVAADLVCDGYQPYDQFSTEQPFQILALDGITNPQNLGMIIRSACAGNINGILIPQKGCAKIDPLVIKASVGTVFKATILYCDSLPKALKHFQQHAHICSLSSHAKQTLGKINSSHNRVFVLGNETHGVSPEVQTLCNEQVRIPMQNNVESLNVAVTAALIAFRDVI